LLVSRSSRSTLDPSGSWRTATAPLLSCSWAISSLRASTTRSAAAPGAAGAIDSSGSRLLTVTI
jgi:hypothetical protein